MVQHKIINNIEHKYCKKCDQWKQLNKFGKSNGEWDKKKPQCILCINSWKKICTYKDCETYAVHGFNNCKTHGGGKKCILCDTPARNKSQYCVKHNSNKCKFEGCDGKPIDSTDYCTLHNEVYRCIYPNCINKKVANKNGYCKTHGLKHYCQMDGCDKICKWENLCDEHYCSGNIERCASILITRTKKQDKQYKGIDRKIYRDNNLTIEYITNLYSKNKNCHWCNNHLELEIGGIFDLSKICIDRIDNKIGHTDNNIVLSCMFCNYAKNVYSSEKWIEIINILNGKTDIVDFRMYKLTPQICRAVSTANAKEKINNIVTTKWLWNQLKIIRWKCSLTKFPIYPCKQPYFPWGISIDRIDGKIGHTQDNCIITARFINLGKNEVPNDKFKTWFSNRFPNCKINKVIYPREFYDKILYKYKDTYLSMISDETVKVLFI